MRIMPRVVRAMMDSRENSRKPHIWKTIPAVYRDDRSCCDLKTANDMEILQGKDKLIVTLTRGRSFFITQKAT